MLRSVLEGFPLLLSLVHPCQWLSGSPVYAGGWATGYYDGAIDPQEHWVGGNRGKDIVLESVQNVLAQGAEMLPEQSEHLMRRMVESNNQIMAEVRALEKKTREISPELPLT
jgi:hypothetical protein